MWCGVVGNFNFKSEECTEDLVLPFCHFEQNCCCILDVLLHINSVADFCRDVSVLGCVMGFLFHRFSFCQVLFLFYRDLGHWFFSVNLAHVYHLCFLIGYSPLLLPVVFKFESCPCLGLDSCLSHLVSPVYLSRKEKINCKVPRCCSFIGSPSLPKTPLLTLLDILDLHNPKFRHSHA